jgi:hypothetical protein
MSEYPYEDRINSNDIVNCKYVFSADGESIGKVEAAIGDSFIVREEKGDTEIKYDIPRLEIERIIDDTITLKLKEPEIREKYQTSSIKKNWE